MAFQTSLWSPTTSKTAGISLSFFGCVSEIVLSVKTPSTQAAEVSQGLLLSGLWEVSCSDPLCGEQNIPPSCIKVHLQFSSPLLWVGTTIYLLQLQVLLY